MIKAQHSIHIDRPVHEVFEFLRDNENRIYWQANLVEQEHQRLTQQNANDARRQQMEQHHQQQTQQMEQRHAQQQQRMQEREQPKQQSEGRGKPGRP